MACRATRPKRELMRIVRTPDGRIVLDETGRLAGRGAYLCRDGTCHSMARAKGVLRRALAVDPTPEIWTALAATVPATSMNMMLTTTDEGGTRGEE